MFHLIFHRTKSGLDEPKSRLHGEDQERARHDPRRVVVLKLLAQRHQVLRSIFDDLRVNDSGKRQLFELQQVVLGIVWDGKPDVPRVQVGQICELRV